MANKEKINRELNKIGNLNERIIRLINLRKKKMSDIQMEFDSKVNKVYTFIEIAREKISGLKGNNIKDKVEIKEIKNRLGIDWIDGETKDINKTLVNGDEEIVVIE